MYFLQSLLGKTIGKRVMKVLASRIVLKTCCKSFFKYSITKNVPGGSGVELGARSKVKLGVKDYSNLSISLSTRKKAWKVVF